MGLYGVGMKKSLIYFLSLAIVAWIVLSTFTDARAQALPNPAGKVILTVTGKISKTNAPGRAEFDRAMLGGAGIFTMYTSTPWTEGVVKFEGVLARDLLAAVGAIGETVSAIAINDYAVEIPVSDLMEHPVIIAYSMNGKPMSVRDKGPLWIIYPLNSHPELDTQTYHSRMIWQLRELTLK
jgi:hypothetical protein